MDEEGSLSSFHKERLEAAVKILDEAFDSILLVVAADTDDLEFINSEMHHKGGRAICIGHAEIAKNQLLNPLETFS